MKRLSKLSTSLTTLAIALVASVKPAFAAIEPIKNGAIPENLTNYAEAKSGATFAFYLVFIYRSLLFIGGLMVIIYFIMGAFEWISANGEASKISSARNKMTGAITGFIVLSAMFVILEFLGGLFGFNLLNLSIPTPDGAVPTVPALTVPSDSARL